MNKYEKEDLEKYIFEENMSYDKIGKLYGVSGAAIRKAAKKLGIVLPKRRKINKSETFNKGKILVEKKICLNCDNELVENRAKYCSNLCQKEFEYKSYISDWKQGLKDGMRGSDQISKYIRRYFFSKYDNKCQECNWSEINIYTNLIPLQIHHIDGDCTNNIEENLELLCPNCHALTDNWGSTNKESTRIRR